MKDKIVFLNENGSHTVLFGDVYGHDKSLYINPTHRIPHVPKSNLSEATIEIAEPWQPFTNPDTLAIYADGDVIVNLEGLCLRIDTSILINCKVPQARTIIAFNYLSLLHMYIHSASHLNLTGTSTSGEKLTVDNINTETDYKFSGIFVKELLGVDVINCSDVYARLTALDSEIGALQRDIISTVEVYNG